MKNSNTFYNTLQSKSFFCIAIVFTFAVNMFALTPDGSWGSNTLGTSSQSENDNTEKRIDIFSGSSTQTGNGVLIENLAVNPYQITASITGGNGSIAPESQTVNEGESATVTLTPNSGYYLTSLTDNNQTVLSQVMNNQYTVTNVTTDHSIVATFTRGFTEVYANSLLDLEGSALWGDFDNDGLLDILITGATYVNVVVTKLYKNTGSGFSEVYPGSLPGVWGGFAAWGDYDNDGDLDLLMSGRSNIASWTLISRIYENTGSGFAHLTSVNLPGMWHSSGAWGDYDNDGDLDFMLSGYDQTGVYAIAKIYQNTGSGFSEVFPGRLSLLWDGSLAWGDYDNDGDLDILQTGFDGGTGVFSKIYSNRGNDFAQEYAGSLAGVYRSSGAWGDYDSDGRLDIVITGTTDGTNDVSKIYRNTGSGFTEAYPGSLQPVEGGSASWGDYDNDGDLDILLTGETATHTFFSKIYQNTGSGFTQVFIGNLTNEGSNSSVWGDYDNDGDVDILMTGTTWIVPREFSSIIYRNNGTTFNSVPDAPAGLMSSVFGSAVMLQWNKASDAQTPQDGLTYNLRIGTTPNDGNILSPMANGLTGYRRVPRLGSQMEWNQYGWTYTFPPGTYYWSVQAIDNAFAGSPFAEEGTFIVYPQQQITSSVTGGGGTIDPEGVVSVDYGSGQSYTITADECYYVASVSVNGGPNLITNTQPSSFFYPFDNVQSEQTITASFSLREYFIDANIIGQGNIDPPGITSVNCGSDITYTFTPSPNYSLVSLVVNGDPIVPAPPTHTIYHVSSNSWLTATFVPNTPFVNLVTPQGGELWKGGETHTISWVSQNMSGNGQLQYSSNGGTSWNTIATVSIATGNYSWLVPYAVTKQAKVRLFYGSGSSVKSNIFTIEYPIQTQNSGTTNKLNDVCFINNIFAFAVGDNSTILKTHTGGKQQSNGNPGWYSYQLLLPSGTLTGVSGYGLNVNPWNDNILIINSSGTVYRKHSKTYSWSMIMTIPNFTAEDITRRGNWGWAVGSEGVVGRIYKSSNSGWNWNSQTIPTVGPLSGVSFLKNSIYVGWAIGNDGTILKTTDGNTWSQQASVVGSNLNDICVLDAQRAWVVGDMGTILVTNDGGTTWVSQPSGTTENLNGVSFSGSMRGFAVGDNGTILRYGVPALQRAGKTLDGEWTIVPSGTTSNLTTVFVSEDRVYMAGDGGTILSQPEQSVVVQFPDGGETLAAGGTEIISWSSDAMSAVNIEHSLDSGNTWNYIAENIFSALGTYKWHLPDDITEAARVRVTNVENENVYDVSDSVFAIARTNLNVSLNSRWNLVSVPVRVDDYRKDTLFPTSVSNAYSFEDGYTPRDTLVNRRGYWLKFATPQEVQFTGLQNDPDTIPVFEGWNIIGSIAENVPVESISSIPDTLTTSQFFGYNSGYFESETIEPGKGYWVKINQDGQLILTSVISSRSLVAKIKILPTKELPPPSPEDDGNTSVASNMKPETFTLEQAYPNPFNPLTVIRYQLPVRSFVTLKVIDLLGREIATLAEDMEDAVVFRKEWNASNVPSGMYFYRISAQGTDGTVWSDVKKMVLIK